MKTICLLFIILIIAILSSCNNLNINNKTSKLFEFSDTLRGEILPGYIDDVTRIYYSEYGIISKSKNKRNFIRIYDTTYVKCKNSYGMIGRGPKEYVNPIGQGYNSSTNNFFVTDIFSHSAGVFKINSDSIKEVLRIPIKDYVVSFQNLDDSTNIILTMFDGQYLKLITNKGKTLDSVEYRVFYDKNINYNKNRNNSTITKIPNKELFIIKTREFPVLDMFSCLNNKIKHLWRKELYSSLYFIENGWFKQNKDKHIESFVSSAASENRIYLTSYLMTLNEYINTKNSRFGNTALFVFDLAGNLVSKSMLDKCVHTITVKPDDSILYGMISSPDVSIVKYKLN